MYIYIIILLLFLLLSIKKEGTEFMTKEQTTVINGVFVILIFSIVCFLSIKPYIAHSSVMNLYSVLFVAVIVIGMRYFTIRNKVFLYLGQDAYYIYMLQRIPMIFLSELTYLESNKHLFILISFVATIVLISMEKPILEYMDKKILELFCGNKG